jgi:ligand-binding SRPBCC domain-containing protein
VSFNLGLAADVAILLVATGMYGLAAYKAYASLNVLRDSAYRSLAILTAAWSILAIPYVLNLFRLDLGISSLPSFVSQFLVVISLAGAFVGFALLDRGIKVGLNLDFFHRDALLWQRGGRAVAWPVIVALVVAFFVFNYAQLLPIAAVLIAYPIAVVLTSTLRARSDAILDFVRWFGVSFATAAVATTVAAFIGYNFLQIFAAFFFYRAAGSLSGSTFHMEFSSLFDAPRDFVYSVYTNPDMLTKITKSYRTAKLQGKDAEGRDVVEITADVLGTELTGIIKRKYIPPDGMEEEAITDTGVGATRFTFTPENGDTRVRFSLDFEPRGALTKLLGGFGANRVRKQFERDGATGKAYCEANRPR